MTSGKGNKAKQLEDAASCSAVVQTNKSGMVGDRTIQRTEGSPDQCEPEEWSSDEYRARIRRDGG